eukprot:m.207497 g.207497  ORF g.207497 m.207497 type:complete len:458 (+) comp32989_c2_seq4:483-1856(+)
MSSAMLLAKQGRAVQMQVLDEYLAGKKVVFKSHQGQTYDFECEYDAEVYVRERQPIKLQFNKSSIFLDAAANVDSIQVSALLEEDIDPNVTNADGLTALHQACIEGSLKVASLLIQNEADVNAKDNDWWTPLHAASACDHWRVVNLLLSKGALVTAVNADGDLPVDVAEDEKTKKVLESEMERLGLTGEKRDDLVDVPEKEFTAQVTELIEAGTHKDYKGPREESLLHIAASNGWSEATKLLIDAGVVVSAIDHEQDTPLHLAAFFGHYEIVEMLGEAGAKVSSLNRYRDNVLMMSEDQTMTRLLKAIQNNQKVAAEGSAAVVKRKRVGSHASTSVKRKSMVEKNMLFKMDVTAEREAAVEFAEQHRNESEDKPMLDADGLPVRGLSGLSFAVPTPSPMSPGSETTEQVFYENTSNSTHSKKSTKKEKDAAKKLGKIDFSGKTEIATEKSGGCCVVQ